MALLKGTFSQWLADNAQRRGAALAYYAAFSIPPLILIALAVAGLTFGNDAANGAVYEQLTDFIGPEASTSVEELVAGARKPAQGVVATIIGFAVLLFGASACSASCKVRSTKFGEYKLNPGEVFGHSSKTDFCHSFLLLVSLVISLDIMTVTIVRTWWPSVSK